MTKELSGLGNSRGDLHGGAGLACGFAAVSNAAPLGYPERRARSSNSPSRAQVQGRRVVSRHAWLCLRTGRPLILSHVGSAAWLRRRR